MSRVWIPSSSARSIIRNTGWKRRQSKHSRDPDTDHRALQFVQYNEFLKSWEIKTCCGLSRYILCHLICMSRTKAFYQVTLFLSVQILAFFFFLKKRAFCFASIIIPTFIPSSEGTQTKQSFLSDFRKYYIDFLGKQRAPGQTWT